MKRVTGVLLTVLVIYVIFYDLNHGTLPAVKEQAIEATSIGHTDSPFFNKKVNPGETVLSIVEARINGPIPISLTEVVSDFKALNGGMEPEEIKSGQSYKFPDYSETSKMLP